MQKFEFVQLENGACENIFHENGGRIANGLRGCDCGDTGCRLESN